MFSIHPDQEFIERSFGTLSFDRDAFRRIRNPAGQLQLIGETVNEWTETDALDSAAYDDADAGVTGHAL